MKKSVLNYVCVGALICIGVFACVKKTTYSTTPEISFNSFTPYVGDSADIDINFKDGDGDIGVGSNDSMRTMWINYYYKDTVTQKYVAFCYGCGTDSLKTSYVIRAPKDSYLGKPISGEIIVRLQQYRHSRKIKNIKYVVYLFDKAGHESNIIETPELIVP
jgi:hypothetical protein